MDISSVSSSSNYQNQIENRPPPPPKKELSSTPLTEDQKSQLEEILSNYDSSEMSPDVIDSIFSDMEEAGIPMSEDTAEILEAQGFGPPEKPQGPPPQGGMESMSSSALATLDEETKDSLISLVESFLSGEIEKTEFDSEVGDLGVEDLVGNLFNEVA